MMVENPRPQTKMSPEFEAKLAAHRVRMAELRMEIGDPREALSRAIKGMFDGEALQWAMTTPDEELDEMTPLEAEADAR